jgi:copper oxidase (laccase) domain-containing protein
MRELEFIKPNWPAPANVKTLQTTRTGGISHAPYASLNLGLHVGDDNSVVAKNRQLLRAYLPSEPVWVNQVHGIDVIDAAKNTVLQNADASFTTLANIVCGP